MWSVFFKRTTIVSAIIWSFFAITNSLMGQDWIYSTAPFVAWDSIASSSDGNTLIALEGNGSIYVSSDSGASWEEATNAPITYWQRTAISEDGSKMIAATDGGSIYVSQDRGITWFATSAPSNYWESVACSTNGNILVAAPFSNGLDNTTPGHIYTSFDFGTNWNASLALESNFWLSVASSADGSNFVAVGSDGTLFVTTNSGGAWFQTTAPNEPWFCTASSADGKKLVAGANGGPICISSDGGNNWSIATNAPKAQWASVTSSSDGQRLAAVQWRGKVYTSSDGGITWGPKNVPDTLEAVGIWSIASSSDGAKLYAAGAGPYGGPLYISQPSPQLNIISSGKDVMISWPTAAAGFTLQQNSNVTTFSWTNVPALPELTNGLNQIVDPVSANSRFYRLIFPAGVPPVFWPFPPFIGF
jgi:photosystem II stability/assembly factor-like uncharacterized protein